jgi:predicted nucleic acid-binding protein
VIENAWEIQDRYQFFEDSLILSAAQVQGCEVLLSEDLQDGQVIGGVRVVNPFCVEWVD